MPHVTADKVARVKVLILNCLSRSQYLLSARVILVRFKALPATVERALIELAESGDIEIRESGSGKKLTNLVDHNGRLDVQVSWCVLHLTGGS